MYVLQYYYSRCASERLPIACSLLHPSSHHLPFPPSHLPLTYFFFLHQSGLASDTLVVYTSDHGEMLGSHGMLGKSCLYVRA